MSGTAALCASNRGGQSGLDLTHFPVANKQKRKIGLPSKVLELAQTALVHVGPQVFKLLRFETPSSVGPASDKMAFISLICISQ